MLSWSFLTWSRTLSRCQKETAGEGGGGCCHCHGEACGGRGGAPNAFGGRNIPNHRDGRAGSERGRRRQLIAERQARRTASRENRVGFTIHKPLGEVTESNGAVDRYPEEVRRWSMMKCLPPQRGTAAGGRLDSSACSRPVTAAPAGSLDVFAMARRRASRCGPGRGGLAGERIR